MPSKSTQIKPRRTKKMFIRLSAEEREELRANADRYADGNVSRWMRDRALRPMLDVSIKMQDDVDASQ